MNVIIGVAVVVMIYSLWCDANKKSRDRKYQKHLKESRTFREAYKKTYEEEMRNLLGNNWRELQ